MSDRQSNVLTDQNFDAVRVMPALDSHPAVRRVRSRQPERAATDRPATIDSGLLRQLVLDAGADDVGFVDIDRPELDGERAAILSAFPATRTLVAFVCRLNRESIRSPARSIANLEFHQTGDEVNAVARHVTQALTQRNIRATNAAMGFPMEMNRFPERVWVVSHRSASRDHPGFWRRSRAASLREMGRNHKTRRRE